MLLGRERERQAIDRLLASARSGHSAVLTLVGEPGIGKTSLLRYAEGRAEAFRVLKTRGIPLESNVPFAALFGLLRPALGLLGRIPRPQADALEAALALRPGEAGDRFAVGAATLSLLAAYGEDAPVLVLVDDAQDVDASSGEALLFAFRRLLAEPLAVLVAAREGERSPLHGAGLPCLHVGGLDLEETTALLGAMPSETAARLHRATAGNPLALLELRDHVERIDASPLDTPLPVSAYLASAFAARAAGLSSRARGLCVLLAASDSGELTLLSRAAASLGLDLGDLVAAEEAGLLRVEEGRAEFRHPLARAAVYGEGTREQRREAHRALAAVLPDRDFDRRAWHLALAAVGCDEAASSALAQAAERAGSRSAYATAAASYERAAELTGDDERRGRLLFEAADSAWLAGHAERAVELLARVRAPAGGGEQLVRIERLRGRIATRRGPVMEGFSILRDAAEQVARSDPELAVVILAEAGDACFFAGEPLEMGAAARRARELLGEDASLRGRFLTDITEGMGLVLGGRSREGIEMIRSGMELAEASDQLIADPQLLPWLVMGPLWIREAARGQSVIEAAIDGARERAAVGMLPWLLDRVARSHAATDSWSLAAIEYDEAVALAEETDQRVELAAALSGLCWLEARTGRDDSSRAHAARARELCRQLGVGLYEIWAIRASGELELGRGRADAAIEELEDAQHRLASLGLADVDLSPGPELVEAYLRCGRAQDAQAAAAEFERAAAAKGQPWSLARAARCRGLVSGAEEHEVAFEEALRLHEQTPDVFETGRTHLAYGARLRRSRQRLRAREQLRTALEIFERLGARPSAEQARDELAATGETARRRDVSTADDLTPQELHIARLLAGGKTTREAAAALFLSPKTIEYHLRSIYRKLGVNSRAALAGALEEQRAGDGPAGLEALERRR
jgi:DNA-binding CsgD family transcriptional regulator